MVALALKRWILVGAKAKKNPSLLLRLRKQPIELAPVVNAWQSAERTAFVDHLRATRILARSGLMAKMSKTSTFPKIDNKISTATVHLC